MKLCKHHLRWANFQYFAKKTIAIEKFRRLCFLMFTNIAKGWSLQRKWFSWQNIGNSLILNDVYITLYVDSLYNMFYLLIEYADKNSEGPFITMHTLEFFNTFWFFEFSKIQKVLKNSRVCIALLGMLNQTQSSIIPAVFNYYNQV